MRTPTIDDVIAHVATAQGTDPANLLLEPYLEEWRDLALELAEDYVAPPPTRRELADAFDLSTSAVSRRLGPGRQARRRPDGWKAVEEALAEAYPGELDE